MPGALIKYSLSQAFRPRKNIEYLIRDSLMSASQDSYYAKSQAESWQ